MSVIIRLQNLPWTANARDIRNFFTGLSIPEGGVHIIGGEMGDAFIAFSTDEDARCAMLKDREKLMEVQVRLLLSSRAEMQKVIETARNVSTAAATVAAVTPTPAAAVTMPPVPQPPVIGSFLGQVQQQQQQQQQQVVPSFLAYQQQAGITLADVAGVKAERHSPDLENLSSSRLRRHSRSRSRSRSTSSDDSDRSRDHSRDRDRHHNRDRDTRRDARGRKRRPDLRSDSSERELKIQPTTTKSNIMPWATVAPATAATVAAVAGLSGVVPGLQQQLNLMSVLQSVPGLQSYSTTNSSTTSNSTTNNYNLNLTAATQQPQQQPKQPQQLLSDLGAQLFQQQQQLLLQQQAAKTAGGMGNSPNPGGDVVSLGGGSGGAAGVGSVGAVASSGSAVPIAETCYIKISGMCPTTSYSDLRKYFAGLYIPHNGIKIVSGANGARTGVAYIEFSRVSSAQKALARNNTMFRNRLVQIVPISDEEFEQVDERMQRNNNRETGGGGGGSSRSSSGTPAAAAPAAAPTVLPPISVLYVEDLPQLTTEQDIMKMFSATCTIVDILLTPSPHNRREFVAFVLFARENEARFALEDTARHYIGFRKLRVRASNQAEMQNAKEKMRRANEQLQKEEQQQREDAEREQQSKQQQQQQQQEQLQVLQAKLSNDPRRRNNNEGQQQQQQQPNLHAHNNNNSHMQPFVNTSMHNGNMPFAFQQQHNNSSNNNGLNMHNNNNNNGMHMNNNNNNGMHMNNNNMPPFAMHSQQMQQQHQHHQQQQHPQHQQHHQQQQPPRRQEDVFVRVHNCEYATRINDLGEFFSSENLRIEHIEMLFNERNQSAGEFIVEFVDAHNAKLAIMEFHNRRFRGRGLRLSPITPQEIADRMNKPFMDFLPGGNGPRQSDKSAHLPQQQLQQQQQQQQQQSRRRGPSRFDDASNRGMGQQQLPPTPQQQQQSLPPPHDSDDSNSSKQQHFNPFAARPGAAELNPDELAVIAPVMNNNSTNLGGVVGPSPDEGIPDKFNRPGCVVAMRNVPFKADLKDILRFFSDYKLSPDDIIRRFNDEGKPTGDARVAFESQSEARSAFETRRRKQIFSRTVYLDII
ncbi:hypothetical protein ACLKA7_014680 [Drosophila subpalustris]